MTFTREQLFSGNANLLRLADYVEERQTQNPEPGYDQTRTLHDCGSPGCLMGHQDAIGDNWRLAESEIYALTKAEQKQLFGFRGCGDARTNWRQAVDFVRAFVRKRQAAMGPRP